MDLTPRTDSSHDTPAARRPKRKVLPVLVLVATIVAGGLVVTRFLTSAIDYYCNVDEVGHRSGCDGDRRMRVQGVVEQGSVQKKDGATTFVMEFHGKKLAVSYLGDPGGVFQECIPVVAHGRVSNGVLESDRIEVKHSNQYVEKNSTRIKESENEAAACSVQQG